MKRGFTLIEVLVVLAIVGIVLFAIFAVYKQVLFSYVRESSVAESNIEGVISLEMLRKDLEMAGFGIPASESPLSYDGTTLTIRTTMLASKDETKCWGYAYKNTTKYFYAGEGDSSICSSACYVALDTNYNLKAGPCYSGSPSSFYLLFGVANSLPDYDKIEYNVSGTPPSSCAPSTSCLSRKDPSTGSAFQPVLDCVKAFKVSFGLDTNNDGKIDSWSINLPTTSQQIREEVREIRVFVLYQEGGKDPSFTYSGTVTLGDNSTGVLYSFTPTGDEVHYRWKVTSISVTPLNLRRESR